MRAASLDRRITIEQAVVVRDATIGSESVTWATLATVWAGKRESSTGSERLIAASNVSARPTKFWMRYRPDVTTAMRINDGGRLFQIIGIAETGRRQGLDVACVEFSHE